MREIIPIRVGPCGNQLAVPFWSSLVNEHGIDLYGKDLHQTDEQIKKVDAFFNETHQGYIPRGILTDL